MQDSLIFTVYEYSICGVLATTFGFADLHLLMKLFAYFERLCRPHLPHPEHVRKPAGSQSPSLPCVVLVRRKRENEGKEPNAIESATLLNSLVRSIFLSSRTLYL